MYILGKNVLFAIYYICLLTYVFVSNLTIGYMDRILVFNTLYYVILMAPKIHHIYVYNIVERFIPRWTYFVRAAFHYTLFYPTLTKSFPSVLCVLMIMLWKDIIFLITHAERRLAKIEMSMYDEEMTHRIAHLHLNVFSDDMENRFHKHCFNTNRLYLLENTENAMDTQLAIHNYRKLRTERKKPREFTGNDKVYYEASSNHKIFISHRYIFMAYPLIILVWLACMTDLSFTETMYMHHGILLADVLSKWFGNKINDIVIDLSYVISMSVIVYVHATHG